MRIQGRSDESFALRIGDVSTLAARVSESFLFSSTVCLPLVGFLVLVCLLGFRLFRRSSSIVGGDEMQAVGSMNGLIPIAPIVVSMEMISPILTNGVVVSTLATISMIPIAVATVWDAQTQSAMMNRGSIVSGMSVDLGGVWIWVGFLGSLHKSLL
ncbi:hypothetical protein NE237_030043 [Protea cynaroides]|uniref:Uncharacterized protein n=1 Tax=Protea cynaroides TaxID=273540 RepID=A0A9Q0GS97_9MAGN|nr:hypothetical protein NE237_030043 [Protea cynaroides]